MYNETGTVVVGQADAVDALGLEFLEIRAAEFPMMQTEIAKAIRESATLSVKATIYGHKVGWCLFTVEEGGTTIDVDRLTVYDNERTANIISSIFAGITFSPRPTDTCKVTFDFPEYGMDGFLFRALLAEGFKAVGTNRKAFQAYNTDWDAILLEKTYVR